MRWVVVALTCALVASCGNTDENRETGFTREESQAIIDQMAPLNTDITVNGIETILLQDCSSSIADARELIGEVSVLGLPPRYESVVVDALQNNVEQFELCNPIRANELGLIERSSELSEQSRILYCEALEGVGRSCPSDDLSE